MKKLIAKINSRGKTPTEVWGEIQEALKKTPETEVVFMPTYKQGKDAVSKVVKGFIPEQCILWKKKNLKEADVASSAFDLVETYVNSSHLSKYLLKCKECGQLYFFEFRERVNWSGAGNGNDYQYSTWIPVGPTGAGSLKDKSSIELLDPTLLPRMQEDLTPYEDNPVHWVK